MLLLKSIKFNVTKQLTEFLNTKENDGVVVFLSLIIVVMVVTFAIGVEILFGIALNRIIFGITGIEIGSYPCDGYVLGEVIMPDFLILTLVGNLLIFYAYKFIQCVHTYHRAMPHEQDFASLSYSQYKVLKETFPDNLVCKTNMFNVDYWESFYLTIAYKGVRMYFNLKNFVPFYWDLSKERYDSLTNDLLSDTFLNHKAHKAKKQNIKKVQNRRTEELINLVLKDIEDLKKQTNEEIEEANQGMEQVCNNIREERRRKQNIAS